jgi:hypothetical protein
MARKESIAAQGPSAMKEEDTRIYELRFFGLAFSLNLEAFRLVSLFLRQLGLNLKNWEDPCSNPEGMK